jgi:hypothetical protein
LTNSPSSLAMLTRFTFVILSEAKDLLFLSPQL